MEHKNETLKIMGKIAKLLSKGGVIHEPDWDRPPQ
jgi:hypothetical protein